MTISGTGSLIRGAALLTLVGYASVSHAQDILNDLTAVPAGGLTGSYLAQDFYVNSGGAIVGITLDLNFSAGASPLGVYLYNASGSGPTTPVSGFPGYGLLGTITPSGTGAQDYAVNLVNNFGLTIGQYYSILVDTTLTTGTVAWEYTSLSAAVAANTGSGTIYSAYEFTGSTWTPVGGGSTAFQLAVVPEPSTTAFIGFGGLTLVFMQRLRRKNP